jgi:hypothetical protein
MAAAAALVSASFPAKILTPDLSPCSSGGTVMWSSSMPRRSSIYLLLRTPQRSAQAGAVAHTWSALQKPLQQIAFGPGAQLTPRFPFGEQQHRMLLPAGLQISPRVQGLLSPVGHGTWRQTHVPCSQSAPAGQGPPVPQGATDHPQMFCVPPLPQVS